MRRGQSERAGGSYYGGHRQISFMQLTLENNDINLKILIYTDI